MQQAMATTQSYQPVVVVQSAVPVQTGGSVNWRNRAIKVGGLIICIPCLICLVAFGCIFIISGISPLVINPGVYLDDGEFAEDDGIIAGIVMLVIGGLFIAGAIGLCVAGLKAYRKYSGISGRVINTAPNVVPAAGAYPVVAPPGQVYSYPAPGPYPAPVPGHPGPYAPPAPGHCGPYPPPAPGHPGPYPPPFGGQLGSRPAAGVYQPATAGPQSTPAFGQMAPFTGGPGPYSCEQYPDVAPPQAPDLPQKAGFPGEVSPMAPKEPYDRPPTYSP